MIIKSHIRPHYHTAATYLKDEGQNEKVRLVEISDFDAETLEEAFLNMWKVASNSSVQKPLHHISINPCTDERLKEDDLFKILRRCEEKYGYKKDDHHRVVVDHVKKDRQHFHIMWNRVSLMSGTPVSPGYDRYKSIKVAREMELELGLRSGLRPQKLEQPLSIRGRGSDKKGDDFLLPQASSSIYSLAPQLPVLNPKQGFESAMWLVAHPRRKGDENIPDSEKRRFAKRPDEELAELLAWAWEHRRIDMLQSFGIILPPDFEF